MCDWFLYTKNTVLPQRAAAPEYSSSTYRNRITDSNTNILQMKTCTLRYETSVRIFLWFSREDVTTPAHTASRRLRSCHYVITLFNYYNRLIVKCLPGAPILAFLEHKSGSIEQGRLTAASRTRILERSANTRVNCVARLQPPRFWINMAAVYCDLTR